MDILLMIVNELKEFFSTVTNRLINPINFINPTNFISLINFISPISPTS